MVFDGLESLENPGPARQVKKRVDSLFAAAHFKVKAWRPPTWRSTDSGNGIALANRGARFYQVLVIVSIDSEEVVIMFKNDEVAVSFDLVIAVDHPPGSCGANLLSPASGDLKAFARATAFLAEFFKDITLKRPAERSAGGGRDSRR